MNVLGFQPDPYDNEARIKNQIAQMTPRIDRNDYENSPQNGSTKDRRDILSRSDFWYKAHLIL
jgi:hypothetical protein